MLVFVCYPLVGMLTDGLQSLNGDFAIAAVGVLAPFVLVAFSTTLLVDNINTAKSRIRALSDRDELTSLYNMRAFARLAEQEHDAAARVERGVLDPHDRHRALEDRQRHLRSRSR